MRTPVRWSGHYVNGRQLRTHVTRTFEESRKVTSGAPQGAVLGPSLSFSHLTNLPEVLKSDTNISAHGAELVK